MDPKAYLDSLSDEQAVAANEVTNPVLLLAGAGTGKTRSLVGRVIKMILPESMGGLGVDPSSIMMVTFTNKAAREMRERIMPVIEQIREVTGSTMGGEPWIGTFHGLSLRILRIEAAKAGLGTNFTIYDESDARALALEVSENLGIESFDADVFFKDLEIAKARLLSHELLAGKFLEITMLREEDENASLPKSLQTWEKILNHFETPDFTRVYSAYQRALQEQNAVDFSDLMNKVTELFRNNPEVRNSWVSTFRHFMVDEVQDINRAQIAWLDQLTNGCREMNIDLNAPAPARHPINTYRLRQWPRATMCMVGDDDQAIYGFRGTDISVMRSLEDRYPGVKICFLTASYRCQPSILSSSNVLVANNTGRYGKNLHAADPRRARRPVLIEEHFSPDAEIRRLVVEARDYIASGRDPREFAVLTRTRDLAKAVAKEMRAAGLPVSEGKASDIRKSAEVRDAMAFAGYIANPQAETMLRRIINKPSRGMGPTSMARVMANAKKKNIGFMEELTQVMAGRVDLPDGAEPYGKAFLRAAKEFQHLISQMRTAVSGDVGAGEAITRLLEISGYLPNLKEQALKSANLKLAKEELDAMMAKGPRDFLTELVSRHSEGRENVAEMGGEDLADRVGNMSENARRIGNLSLLIDQAASFESLTAFMQEAMLEMNQETAQAGIQVMTGHASKGLEFDYVRLPFWMEGLVPHGRAIEEGDAAIEEERRLAYVMLTRAREDVRITHSVNVRNCPFIRLRQVHKARFLAEIASAPRGDFARTVVKGKNNRLYQSVAFPPLSQAERDKIAAALESKKPAPGHAGQERAVASRPSPVVAAPAAPANPSRIPAVAAPARPGPAKVAAVAAPATGPARDLHPDDRQEAGFDRPFAPMSEEDFAMMPDYGFDGDRIPDYGLDADFDPAELKSPEEDTDDNFEFSF